jgi:hypothetical protein
MYILANLYIDPIGLYYGLVFLIFSFFAILFCEYFIYRIINPKQGPLRAFLITIYTNTISGVLGICFYESAEDVVLFYITTGLACDIILFITFWFLTCLLEAFLVLPLRKKLRIEKVFRASFLVNTISYILLAILIGIFELIT